VSPAHADNTARDPQHARRWWILVLVAAAQLMVVLDVTIVNIALPSAQDALHFSDSDRQWIVTAYTLAFGSLLLTGGRLADLIGAKRTFVAGLIGFAVVSAVGGASQSFAMLAGARAVQGAFGALLAPTALSVLTTTFTNPNERGRAFGVFGGIAVSGAAVGLLLGGALTEYLSWRWCLFVNLVLAIPTAVAALALLQTRVAAVKPRLDVAGALTAVTGLFAIVYGFNNAERHSWGSTTTIAFLAVGVVLLAAFVAIERRAEHPLLPMRIVLDRNRGGSYLAVGIAGIGIFGAFFFLTFYLQQTLGYSPVKTGFAFLPQVAAVMMTATTASSLLLPRTGPRPLMATGLALAAVGMALLTQVGVHSSYAEHVLPGLVVSGLGLGLAITVALNTGTLGVAPAEAGVASATLNTMQQIGGSLGTALLSTMSASAASGYVAGKQPTAAVVAHATVHGYTVAFWWAAAFFAAGAVICGRLLHGGPPQLVGEPSPVPA
jgi:EmrB/QacA subfamily drug resistance transporter